MADSALFTGKGTPWGPMDTGRPDNPTMETDFLTDPNAVKTGFQYGPQRRLAAERAASGAGRATEQALASLGRAGVQGADTTRALSDVAAGQTGALAQSEADLALAEWQDKMNTMRAINEAKAMRNQMAMQKYGMDLGAFGNEQGARGRFIGDVLGLGATGAGAYFGGKAGASARPPAPTGTVV